MKEDITIPNVVGVHVAIVKEKIPNSDNYEWNIYIINNLEEDLSLVIIVSEGFSKTKHTSTLRKTINHLPKKSYAKIEFLQEELFGFTNQFKVSYFIDNKLYDKTFVFEPNSINKENFEDLPLIDQKGIMAS